ncbi:MAG: response regulator, partial [Anaeroplasmataceae bacterium]|nr:response regulator [Anaeroplasmataceae bacterium]
MEKKNILICEDNEMNREILCDILSNEFNIIEAENGLEAVNILHQRADDIDILLLDIVMPVMDGFDVLAVMNKCEWINTIPVVMISSEAASSVIHRAYELGAVDFINRPFDASIVHKRVQNTITLFAKQKKLINMVADEMFDKEKSNHVMINILSDIVEFRNGESGLHVLHINTMTNIILKKLVEKTDRYHLNNDDIARISLASSLHDIGKMAIPEEILNKKGRFTDEEYSIMKNHTIEGGKLLDKLEHYQDEALVKTAYEICRWHHERYDGKGYPDGLSGEDIPISAQVVSIADVYDALTSERCYKAAYSHDQAVQMILNNECGVFNPLLIECLLESQDQIQSELMVSSASSKTKNELKEMVTNILKQDNLATTTTKEMNLDKDKLFFYLNSTEDILFHYICQPPVLFFENDNYESFGLRKEIFDPIEDEALIQLLGKENIERIINLQNLNSDEMLKIEFTHNDRSFKVICKKICKDDVMHGIIG